MEVTMTKKQTRDLQVFMTCETSAISDQYEPIIVDMSDICEITHAKAYLIAKCDTGDSSIIEVTECTQEDIRNAESIELTCKVRMSSTGLARTISFFANPYEMGRLIYPDTSDEWVYEKMADDLDDFTVLKFFWDIANGNTRSPYTEAMMGSNK